MPHHPPPPTPPRHAQGRVEGGEITVHDFAFSPRVFARGIHLFPHPPDQRAQGRPGARCTRGLVCKIVQKKRTRAYRFSGDTPAFPAQWFTAYSVLSPVNGSFATVALRVLTQDLTPAPRCQDHTIL